VSASSWTRWMSESSFHKVTNCCMCSKSKPSSILIWLNQKLFSRAFGTL
jgi:hypothetical protein